MGMVKQAAIQKIYVSEIKVRDGNKLFNFKFSAFE
jgi:hypothetical protein